MTEPVLFGIPLSLLFLYFIVYSFLGWAMETTYCSLVEKRFVVRGFLYGPICPIYGAGVLMMICWFAPLTGNPFLFYTAATVVMSAWEYFVGWFLEATTHIKYWDYSMFRFNLNGRICLWVCLMWGVLAYLVIFWLHPLVSGLLDAIPIHIRYIADGVLGAMLAADVTVTIRHLALMTKVIGKLNEVSDELRLQAALGKAELSDRLEAAKEELSDRLEAAKDSARAAIPAGSKEKAEALRARYNELMDKAERYSRHLRYVYRDMSSKTWSESLERVKETGRELKARLKSATHTEGASWK